MAFLGVTDFPALLPPKENVVAALTTSLGLSRARNSPANGFFIILSSISVQKKHLAVRCLLPNSIYSSRSPWKMVSVDAMDSMGEVLTDASSCRFHRAICLHKTRYTSP